jgi:hypothetical protein
MGDPSDEIGFSGIKSYPEVEPTTFASHPQIPYFFKKIKNNNNILSFFMGFEK